MPAVMQIPGSFEWMMRHFDATLYYLMGSDRYFANHIVLEEVLWSFWPSHSKKT